MIIPRNQVSLRCVAVRDVPISAHPLRCRDAFTRGCLARKVDTGLSSHTIVRELDQLIGQRSVPHTICFDHRLAVKSRHFVAWAIERRIYLRYLPGRPWQRHAKSFAETLREAQEK